MKKSPMLLGPLVQCFPHIDLFVADRHNTKTGCHVMTFYFMSCASPSHSRQHQSVSSMMLYTPIQWIAAWFLVRQ